MKIRENVSLKALNTFGLDVKARYFCSLHKLSGVRTLMAWQAEHPDLPLLFLGGGSNILFAGDYAGLVVQVRLQALEVSGEDKHYHYIRVGAGNNWHELVRWTVEQGYAGLENLSLIPGTVGAAPMQNIGAYGVEFKDLCFEVQCLDWRTGELRDFSLEECQFTYRDSYFKSIEPNRWLIVAVVLRLPKQPTWKTEYAGLSDVLAGQTLSARTISDAVIAVRQSKLPDPAQIGNAGSFFKNPTISAEQYAALKPCYPNMPAWPQAQGVKLSAGWLIDQCGWKGQRDGDAGTYDKHALVLVNHGNASGAALWQFAQRIIASVQTKFGVTLEPEPKVVGG